jgi:glycosyltransferase involved in cell wall biosynthesis
MHPEVEPKLRVVPLTVNVGAYLPCRHIRRYTADRPLRVLFAGGVNLRKGIPYLLEAFKQIDVRDAELTVVGGIQLRPEKLAPYKDGVDFRGAIPHVRMPEVYRDADLFVFPTISDGFGAVMLEAMATGLPVISTHNCGDIVVDGTNGYQIPIREPDAIAEKIYEIVRQPELLEHLSAGAIATSHRYSLESYQAMLCEALGCSSASVE